MSTSSYSCFPALDQALLAHLYHISTSAELALLVHCSYALFIIAKTASPFDGSNKYIYEILLSTQSFLLLPILHSVHPEHISTNCLEHCNSPSIYSITAALNASEHIF